LMKSYRHPATEHRYHGQQAPPARPLEVVFLTNFTDFSYHSVPAIAQMADDFPMRLTLLHATRDRVPTEGDRAKLDSFFPEADSYLHCRRLVMKGGPVEAVKRLTLVDPVDLLIAPASDPLGLPRFWHPSLRARLMRETRVPLWTIDRKTDPDKLRNRPKRVGCWVDFHHRGWTKHLEFAAAYAAATGAELHVLHALPLVGAALDDARPLHRSTVVEAVTNALSQLAPMLSPAQIHVAENDRKRSQNRLIENAKVDLVFTSDPNPSLPYWLAPKPRLMNDCVSCPVVCVPADTDVPVWRMQRERDLPTGLQVETCAVGGVR
jgi:hypothetical protein